MKLSNTILKYWFSLNHNKNRCFYKTCYLHNMGKWCLKLIVGKHTFYKKKWHSLFKYCWNFAVYDTHYGWSKTKLKIGIFTFINTFHCLTSPWSLMLKILSNSERSKGITLQICVWKVYLFIINLKPVILSYSCIVEGFCVRVW